MLQKKLYFLVKWKYLLHTNLKKRLIYEIISTWKITSDFTWLCPVSQFIHSQIVKWKYEKFQMLGFAKKLLLFKIIITSLILFIKVIIWNSDNKELWHRDQKFNRINMIVI
jgi:hypothetical protein